MPLCDQSFKFGLQFNFAVDNVFCCQQSSFSLPIPLVTYLVTENGDNLIAENADKIILDE